MNKQELYQLEITPLTPNEVNDIYRKGTGHDTKIIFADDVKMTDNIDTIFDADDGIIIFWPVMSKYNGHYTCCFRNSKGYFFSDSYGGSPAYMMNLIDRQGHVKVNRNLFKLIKKTKKPLFVNNVDYQSKTDTQISDCGRYAALTLILHYEMRSKGKDMNFDVLYNTLTQYKNKHKLQNYDQAVTQLTNQIAN